MYRFVLYTFVVACVALTGCAASRHPFVRLATRPQEIPAAIASVTTIETRVHVGGHAPIIGTQTLTVTTKGREAWIAYTANPRMHYMVVDDRGLPVMDATIRDLNTGSYGITGADGRTNGIRSPNGEWTRIVVEWIDRSGIVHSSVRDIRLRGQDKETVGVDARPAR